MAVVDLKKLSRVFDQYMLDRARELVRLGCVRTVNADDPSRITATFYALDGRAYHQIIALTEQGPNLRVRGACSCQEGRHCPHVAAALIYLATPQSATGPTKPLPSDDAPPPNPVVGTWLTRLSEAAAPASQYGPEDTIRLFYTLGFLGHPGQESFVVVMQQAQTLKNGGFGKTRRIGLQFVYNGQAPKYILKSDERLIRSLYRNLGSYGQEASIRLSGIEGARHLRQIIQSGRAVWSQIGTPPLKLGEERDADLVWEELPDGSQQLTMGIKSLIGLPVTPPWYYDHETQEVGPLRLPVPEPLIEGLLTAPPIPAEEAEPVRRALAQLMPGRPDLLPRSKPQPTYRKVEPVPHMHLDVRMARYEGRQRRRNGRIGPLEADLPIATITYRYDGREFPPNTKELRIANGESVEIIPRRVEMERFIETELAGTEWTKVADVEEWRLPKLPPNSYVITPADPSLLDLATQDYLRFLVEKVPELRQKGWVIEGNFDLPSSTDYELHIEATEDGIDWFGLELGILVDGERVELLPLILGAERFLESLERSLAEENLEEELRVYHQLSNGKVISIPLGRLSPIYNALLEVFGARGLKDDLRLSSAQAAEAQAFFDAIGEAGLDWRAPERLRELGEKLASFERIEPVPSPEGLVGTLRPYQAQGLAWLQFLRKFDFGGILADDMGLGKTVQTLAHVLIEKEAGRLDRPALIVAPTSTLPNWRREAERFAPGLRVLVLHGSARRQLFSSIGEYDIVITSYPLLTRDRAALSQVEFHLAVFDEAQNVKNPSAAVSQAARSIVARHRICLSGTPVENRLDELWSLFHLVMPGFLDSLERFRSEVKLPVERGDSEARQRLQRRIRPFMLRRTKEEVATELPAKTEIVEQVDLNEGQRDLYESLRLTMDKRVRDLLAEKGLQRGRIEILDALLKLRQVCGDPRLVKLESAREIQGSAKLERCLEMIREMLDEGRRILLFSQFTSMLDLIEEELRRAEITWVRISGDTKDRETPVQRFQNGEVPLFLISLRAGGTGLNLTAADTVIHYDPWWNPAVERQATDRAYRIGQDKPVFVYKLVASGTVEERILALQERKAKLAESIFGDEDDPMGALTAEDLQWILRSEG